MHKRFLKRIISALLAVLLIIPYGVLLVGSTTEIFGDTATELDNAKDKKDDTDEKIKDTENELENLKQQSSDAMSYIAKLDDKMVTLDNSLYELNLKIEALNGQIEEAKVGLEKAEIDSDLQYQAMKLRIQFMYEHNDENYFDILLASSSLADLLNKADYITKISEYDRQKLIEYQEVIDYIAQTKKDLETDYLQLEEMMNNLEQQRSDLAVVQAAKEKELKSLETQVTSTEKIKQQLEADREQQEKDILALTAKKQQEDEAKKAQESQNNQQAQLNGSNNSSTNTPSSTGFIWPTISRRITSPWGDTEDRTSPHKGVDVGAVKPGVSGDPIYAAAAGTVIIARLNTPSAGNYVTIDHGNGMSTVYMHASALKVSVGDKVTQGQVIALMGTTGYSTGVHLHFGMIKNGAYVNPMNYVSP